MSKSSFTDLTTAYSAYRGQSRGSYRGSSGSNFRGNRYNNRGSYRGRNGNLTGKRVSQSNSNKGYSGESNYNSKALVADATSSVNEPVPCPSPHQLNGSSIASTQSTSASSQPRSSSQPPSQHLLHTPITSENSSPTISAAIPHAENSSPVASNSIPQTAIPHAEISSHVASNSISQAVTRSPILPPVVSNQSSHHPMITRSKLGIRKPRRSGFAACNLPMRNLETLGLAIQESMVPLCFAPPYSLVGWSYSQVVICDAGISYEEI
ncbi:hypothetical protein U1Q18_002153 [Sarracenia purpurea var. burkii]